MPCGSEFLGHGVLKDAAARTPTVAEQIAERGYVSSIHIRVAPGLNRVLWPRPKAQVVDALPSEDQGVGSAEKAEFSTRPNRRHQCRLSPVRWPYGSRHFVRDRAGWAYFLFETVFSSWFCAGKFRG
jgi:hypothetical protein